MKTEFPKNLVRLAACLTGVALIMSASAAQKQVLVVSVTKGFRHDVIPTVDKVLGELAQQSGKFSVDYVKTDQEMAEKMTRAALDKYDAVVFNNTTGDLPLPDRQGFLDWIKSGKGFVGFHAATDTFAGFPEYIDMIGGQFQTHHEQVEVEVIVEDASHPSTRHFPKTFRVMDEIYLLKNFNRSKVHGLLTLDKHPNFGIPGDYPIAWCKEYGQGRVLYSSLGHRKDVAERPDIKQHYLGAILWAVGLEPGDAKPVSKRVKLSESELREGFKPLFNGEDLTGWHYRDPNGTKSWSAQNGMLVNQVPKDGHGTDLVTDAKFMNFTVRFEYMVPKNSNSGFYLRGRHEIQILDDGDAKEPSRTSNGSIYNLIAPSKMASRKAGQWQEVEATIIGNKVTVILNGEKIIDNATVDRPTGGQLDDRVNEPGSIFLQGDHGNVAFRNIRIKELP